MTTNSVKKLLMKGKSIWSHLFTISTMGEVAPANLPISIISALEEFADVSEEPTTLPPKRFHDHFIPLLPKLEPVSIIPYGYNYFHKNEIEKQVEEILTNGIIQPSHSPFLSPVLPVKKIMALGGFMWTIWS